MPYAERDEAVEAIVARLAAIRGQAWQLQEAAALLSPTGSLRGVHRMLQRIDRQTSALLSDAVRLLSRN